MLGAPSCLRNRFLRAYVRGHALWALTFVDRRRSRTGLAREAATPVKRAVVEKPFGFEPIRLRNASRLAGAGSLMIGRAAVQLTSHASSMDCANASFPFPILNQARTHNRVPPSVCHFSIEFKAFKIQHGALARNQRHPREFGGDAFDPLGPSDQGFTLPTTDLLS